MPKPITNKRTDKNNREVYLTNFISIISCVCVFMIYSKAGAARDLKFGTHVLCVSAGDIG